MGSGRTDPVTHTGALNDTVSFDWDDAGSKAIALTVSNKGNVVTAHFNVLIAGDATQPVTPEDGGELTYEGDDGASATVTVVPGGVSDAATLVYTDVVAVDPPDLMSGGLAFDLTAYRNGNPLDDFAFEQPVNVALHYTDDAVAAIDEERLLLYVREGGQWIDAASTCDPAAYTRDLENNTLTTSICHLSHFGLFGPEALPPMTVFLPIVSRP